MQRTHCARCSLQHSYADMSYQSLNGLYEVPGVPPPTFADREAISRYVSGVNALDAAALDAQVLRMRTFLHGGVTRLHQAVISTGGGYLNAQGVRVRWPDVTADFSCYSAPTGQPQVTVPVNSLAKAQIVSWYESQGFPTDDPSIVKLNVSGLMWRSTHQYREIPVSVEISHLAEAYHNAANWPVGLPPYLPGFRCEVSELEDWFINESRKPCARFGLMWRSALDGSVLSADSTDPSMCWHGTLLGSPCYGPRPCQDFEPAPPASTARKWTPTSGEAAADKEAYAASGSRKKPRNV